MKAYIYVGGEIFADSIYESPKKDDLCIAADSGYLNAMRLGAHADILVGDMDSLGATSVSKEVEVIKLPPEKDATDTQIAVEIALKKGAREIVIIGGLSGRLDHTLSNLAILEDMEKIGVHAVILDGKNRIRFMKSSSTLIGRSEYNYISLIAADEKVKGVSIEGCKYPLKNSTVERKFQYAVSNEIVGNCALISVKKGGVFIVESKG